MEAESANARQILLFYQAFHWSVPRLVQLIQLKADNIASAQQLQSSLMFLTMQLLLAEQHAQQTQLITTLMQH
jgi:hypothetical protein